MPNNAKRLSEDEIAPQFANPIDLENVMLPEDFAKIIENRRL